MIGVLTNSDIELDRDIIPQSEIEIVENSYNDLLHNKTCLPQPYKDILPEPSDHSSSFSYSLMTPDNELILFNQNSIKMKAVGNVYNKEITNFFLDKWTTHLNNLIEAEDEYLTEENIDKPNSFAINSTYQVILELSRINIFPEKLSTSAEEGICLTFKNNDKILYFEIYNSGELGYIIEDSLKCQIIENEDVYTTEDIVSIVSDFITK